jgi:ParB family chromosome partitioning protein
VRKTGREADIEQLAASIAAHGLLHPLVVAPETGKNEEPTGNYGVIAGGRRLAALKLLAKRKALPKAAPIPCVRVEDGGAEVSLAENVTQAPMHPADQYEAFAALHAGGMSAEDVGARFGLSERTVKQRLRLGAASPKLMALYREGALRLDQLMAFCLTDDHAAQERVWDSLSYNKEPYLIRRALTQGQVDVTDRRAVFIGLPAYEAAGGVITRDLFSQDEGQGFLADPALLEQLVVAKLEEIGGQVRAEGWKWVKTQIDFDRAEVAGLRRVYPAPPQRSGEAEALLATLEAEFEQLPDDHPDYETEAERLDTEIDALRGEALFNPDDIARGGAWVSLGHDGHARIERGFIRPEDMQVENDEEAHEAGEETPEAHILDHPAQQTVDDDEHDLPARLLNDLTAHRTAALRDSVATHPDIAYLAVLHAFALHSFYWGDARYTCLDITVRQPELAPFADAIDANPGHREAMERHAQWAQRLPKSPSELWTAILDLSVEGRAALLAHCAALSVDAVQRWGESRNGKHAHADQLVATLNLDMTAYWQPTVESYFSRVTKAQIVTAVRESKGDVEADRMTGMKKADMATRAENLLRGSGWLPLALRTPQTSVETDPATKAA